MKKDWTYKEFGAIVNFDKRFQGIDKSLQSSIVHFNHVSAEALKELSVPEGNVKLLSTGLFDGTTTEEKAGQNLNDGEVISIPTGGTPNIKYYKGKFVDSGNILCVAKDENICLRYVYYALRGNITQIANNFRGASILHPQMSKIWQIKLPVPPISIQESIVRELDAIHGILEKKQEQLRELDNLAQSLFYKMFGELDNYDLDTLANLYKFIDYRGKTPNKIEQGIPLVTARNVRCGYMDYTVKDYISAVEYTERQSRGIARKGDILFTTEAPLGYAALADLAEFSTGQRIIALQLQDSKKVNNIFVLRYILSTEFQQLLLQNATGATAQGIKAEKLKKLSIPLPPLSLQQSFAAKIEAIEAQKQAITQSIQHTEALLAQRMDTYFG